MIEKREFDIEFSLSKTGINIPS